MRVLHFGGQYLATLSYYSDLVETNLLSFVPPLSHDLVVERVAPSRGTCSMCMLTVVVGQLLFLCFRETLGQGFVAEDNRHPFGVISLDPAYDGTLVHAFDRGRLRNL